MNSALFRTGLVAGDRPPRREWIDPTRPRPVVLTIRGTLPAFKNVTDPNAAVDQALSEIDGYVAGSANVDLDAKRLTFEAYPGSQVERLASLSLIRIGINAFGKP